MNKIKEIIVGTNNIGKYKEICHLLPKKIKKYSPNHFNLKSPEETGSTFEENSFIKAKYFSKKTGLICISDDSGLEIKLLKGQPGIYSSRWSGEKNNFNLAIKKIYKMMIEIDKKWEQKNNNANFICSMTLYWPSGKNFTVRGTIKGKISNKKKGKKGFGYDPIFIPKNYKQTFGQMNPRLKMSIDHRYKAFRKIKNFFI